MCSANQWDAQKTSTLAAGIGQQKGPNSPWWCSATHHTTNTSKVEWIGLCSSPHPTIFAWPLANWLPLLQASQQLFVKKTLPQPAGDRKCFPRVCPILKHGFYTIRINKLISHGQKLCWLCECFSHSVMSNSLWPHGLGPTRLLYPWDFPGKNTGVGCHSLLQGIFPTQGSNLDITGRLFTVWATR